MRKLKIGIRYGIAQIAGAECAIGVKAIFTLRKNQKNNEIIKANIKSIVLFSFSCLYSCSSFCVKETQN